MSTKAKKRALLWGVLLLFGVACGVGIGSLGSADAPTETAFTEQHLVLAGKRKKQVGEDCTVHGESECLNRLICLHTSPEPFQGYVCSHACRSNLDCPEGGWLCSQLYPGPDAQFCTPPASWVPAVAKARRPQGGP